MIIRMKYPHLYSNSYLVCSIATLCQHKNLPTPETVDCAYNSIWVDSNYRVLIASIVRYLLPNRDSLNWRYSRQYHFHRETQKNYHLIKLHYCVNKRMNSANHVGRLYYRENGRKIQIILISIKLKLKKKKNLSCWEFHSFLNQLLLFSRFRVDRVHLSKVKCKFRYL